MGEVSAVSVMYNLGIIHAEIPSSSFRFLLALFSRFIQLFTLRVNLEFKFLIYQMLLYVSQFISFGCLISCGLFSLFGAYRDKEQSRSPKWDGGERTPVCICERKNNPGISFLDYPGKQKYILIYLKGLILLKHLSFYTVFEYPTPGKTSVLKIHHLQSVTTTLFLFF